MPRPPTRKVDAGVVEVEASTRTANSSKRRTSFTVEIASAEAKGAEPSPSKSRNKRGKAGIDLDRKSFDIGKELASGVKVNRVKAKATVGAKERPTKRTAPVEDDHDLEENKANKTTKKRKTKEEKENEAMPMAVRTAVESLKHAMHIGAHISAAGGVYSWQSNAVFYN